MAFRKRKSQGWTLSPCRGADIVNMLGESIRELICAGFSGCLIVVVHEVFNIPDTFYDCIYTKLVANQEYHKITRGVTSIASTFDCRPDVLLHI